MKTKSEAFKKAEASRDRNNPNATKIVAKDLTSTVFYYTDVFGNPCMRAYRGRALKPAVCYRYKDEAARKKGIIKFMESCSANKHTYKPDPRKLEVGDVLKASWGYDQTNVDYYKVLSLKGKTMVVIAEIASFRSYDDIDSGSCSPDVSKIIGEPMTKKANGDRVRIASYCSAYKVEPTIVNGAKVYGTSSWTAYH